jgi:glycosyltransferase involved in cell wall biosynthesis
MQPFVSVIIPVKDDRERLQKCLTALYFQSYPYACFEVIVVDNNSIENLLSVCQNFPNVRYFRELKPGNNAARNRGIAQAKGDIIAITDADCIPDREWLTEGVRSLLHHPHAGIVGGAIQFFCQGKRPNPVEYADSVCYLQQERYVSRDHYAAGANLFTRRDVLEKVGLFEERLLNLGDKEWGQRVYEAGFEVLYCEKAIVEHPARVTIEALLAKVRRQTRAQAKLCELRREKLPRVNCLPMGWRFFRAVLRDQNLLTLKEKLQFVWVMHRVKWAIALSY